MDLYEVYELENKYNYIINNKLSKDVKTQKVAEYIASYISLYKKYRWQSYINHSNNKIIMPNIDPNKKLLSDVKIISDENLVHVSEHKELTKSEITKILTKCNNQLSCVIIENQIKTKHYSLRKNLVNYNYNLHCVKISAFYAITKFSSINDFDSFIGNCKATNYQIDRYIFFTSYLNLAEFNKLVDNGLEYHLSIIPYIIRNIKFTDVDNYITKYFSDNLLNMLDENIFQTKYYGGEDVYIDNVIYLIKKCEEYKIQINYKQCLDAIMLSNCTHNVNVDIVRYIEIIKELLNKLNENESLEVMENACIRNCEVIFDAVYEKIKNITPKCLSNACYSCADNIIMKLFNLKMVPTLNMIENVFTYRNKNVIKTTIELVLSNDIDFDDDILNLLIKNNIVLDLKHYNFKNWSKLAYMCSLYDNKDYENQLIFNVNSFSTVRKIYMYHKDDECINEINDIKDNILLLAMNNYAYHCNRCNLINYFNSRNIKPSPYIFMDHTNAYYYFKNTKSIC